MKYRDLPDVRWDRLGIKYNIVESLEDGFIVNHCKKGNLSLKRVYVYKNPVSNLNKCSICGRLGTARIVSERRGYSTYDGGEYSRDKSMLCISCFNKIRPIMKSKKTADEIKSLTNKLKKEIRKWQK